MYVLLMSFLGIFSCCCLVAKTCLTLATPWTIACQVPLSMEFPRRKHWSGLPFPPPGDLPNPGIEPRSPALQVDSLPSELPGKPKNTRVGSQSLLQGIFLTQELNQGFLYCRRILYQIAKWQPHSSILAWKILWTEEPGRL